MENISLESLDSGRTERYRRFRLTNGKIYDTISSISLRVPLGTENGIFWNTGDAHDEEGHISEDPNNRTIMMNKRMGKPEIHS